jgi:hypothetical protein
MPRSVNQPTHAEVLGLTAEEYQYWQDWNCKDQPHYSVETRQALVRYQIIATKFPRFGKYLNAQDREVLSKLQQAWDVFLALRNKETGVGYYLDETEYQERVNGNTG